MFGCGVAMLAFLPPRHDFDAELNARSTIDVAPGICGFQDLIHLNLSRTAQMLEQPLKFFFVFFVVVEPVSLIPLFSGLTQGATAQYKRRMALRAVLVAAAILVLFALGGAAFLDLMGISLDAF